MDEAVNSERAPATIAFDIIGTCFGLGAPQRRLQELGAPEQTLELWFAQTLRDAFALSHAGGYRPLKEMLAAELPRTLTRAGVQASPDDLSRVVAAFAELEPQPGLGPALSRAAGAGVKLLALTNGSADSTRQLLERAGVLGLFAALLSCDEVRRTKPHPEVYALARRGAEGEPWLVAAHSWDVAGAVMAGLHGAYLTGEEGAYLEGVYPAPQVTAASLEEAVDAILGRI
jgi:2-haloacid dehalogenase